MKEEELARTCDLHGSAENMCLVCVCIEKCMKTVGWKV